jgi:hypothetical protein
LLAGGRTSRYLLYAIGEILLVVIGILIALQINNWNEWRKNRSEEQQILLGLKAEFEGHLSQLDYFLNQSKDHASGMWLFMSHIAEPDSQYSITELDKGLEASISAITWDPSNSVLDAMISSGRLPLIMDLELQNRLAGWTSVVDEVRDNQVINRDHSEASLWSALVENGVPNARGIGSLFPELHTLEPEQIAEQRYRNIRGNLEIVDLIAIKYAVTVHSAGEIESAIQETKEILSLIDDNLR